MCAFAVSTPTWALETMPRMQLASGKSSVITLPTAAIRLSVGNPEVADVMLINPREVYVLGKKQATPTSWSGPRVAPPP